MTSVSASSTQFNKLEYSVQVALCASTARLLKATAIANPSQALLFEKRSKNILTIEAWIDCAGLCGTESEQEALKKLSGAVKVSEKGVKFNYGAIPADKSKRINKKLIYCKVAIGRSMVIENEGFLPGLPEGYDSYVIQSSQAGGEFHYIVNKDDQILPLYLVNVEFDPIEEQRSREKPMCDNCEISIAAVYCTADNAHLCKECDQSLHSANKVVQKHKRTAVGKGSDSFGNCRAHHEKIEYFCSQCQIPVCVHCKMIGHHSQGEASKHKLVRVMEAFETVIKESNRGDSGLEEHLARIENQKKAIEARNVEIERLHVALQEDLTRKYKEAVENLRYAIETKKKVLVGDKIELLRERFDIQRTEHFLRYQQESADLYPLLFSWSTHQQLRQALREFDMFRDYIDVYPDLKVDGTLKIVQDKASKTEQCYVPTSRTSPSKLTHQGTKTTTNFFAETLNILDGISHERSSVVNDEAMEEWTAGVPAFEKLSL